MFWSCTNITVEALDRTDSLCSITASRKIQLKPRRRSSALILTLLSQMTLFQAVHLTDAFNMNMWQKNLRNVLKHMELYSLEKSREKCWIMCVILVTSCFRLISFDMKGTLRAVHGSKYRNRNILSSQFQYKALGWTTFWKNVRSELPCCLMFAVVCLDFHLGVTNYLFAYFHQTDTHHLHCHPINSSPTCLLKHLKGGFQSTEVMWPLWITIECHLFTAQIDLTPLNSPPTRLSHTPSLQVGGRGSITVCGRLWFMPSKDLLKRRDL